jgi:hypothetical protein
VGSTDISLGDCLPTQLQISSKVSDLLGSPRAVSGFLESVSFLLVRRSSHGSRLHIADFPCNEFADPRTSRAPRQGLYYTNPQLRRTWRSDMIWVPVRISQTPFTAQQCSLPPVLTSTYSVRIRRLGCSYLTLNTGLAKLLASKLYAPPPTGPSIAISTVHNLRIYGS